MDYRFGVGRHLAVTVSAYTLHRLFVMNGSDVVYYGFYVGRACIELPPLVDYPGCEYPDDYHNNRYCCRDEAAEYFRHGKLLSDAVKLAKKVVLNEKAIQFLQCSWKLVTSHN